MDNKEEKPQIPMALRPFFKNVKDLKGKLSTVEYEKECDPKKKFVGEVGKVTKRSKFQVRAGIEYENIKTVKEAHESGERERKGLPESMVKVDTGCYHHKYKKRWYVGCTPVENPNSVNETIFEVDGEPKTLDEVVTSDGHTLREVLYAADVKSNKEDSEWLYLPQENIQEFTGV